MVGMSFLRTTFIGCVMSAMKLILLPPNLDPSSGQDVFHCSIVELCELFVELTFKLESLLEGVNLSLQNAEWNGFLLSIEATDIVAE